MSSYPHALKINLIAESWEENVISNVMDMYVGKVEVYTQSSSICFDMCRAMYAYVCR